jgi:hypothetical protein
MKYHVITIWKQKSKLLVINWSNVLTSGILHGKDWIQMCVKLGGFYMVITNNDVYTYQPREVK